MPEDHHTPRSGRYSPLRYPGGKGKLASYIRKVVDFNGLSDGTYVEPYAGGAAVAMELLLTEVVSRVAINDLSPQIHAFWYSVLYHTEELCRLVRDTSVTVDEWDVQKAIMMRGDQSSLIDLGFATFFLNRTNRSGILNGGIIGGRAQKSPWTISARYNAKDLVERIEAIARLSSRITLTNLDAVELLRSQSTKWGERTLVYLDPPYYVKGGGLYYHSYKHEDHLKIRATLDHLTVQKWIVSYDNVPEIEEMYRGYSALKYSIGYSARQHTTGSEVMFFGPGVGSPPVSGSIVELSRTAALIETETVLKAAEPA